LRNHFQASADRLVQVSVTLKPGDLGGGHSAAMDGTGFLLTESMVFEGCWAWRILRNIWTAMANGRGAGNTLNRFFNAERKS